MAGDFNLLLILNKVSLWDVAVKLHIKSGFRDLINKLVGKQYQSCPVMTWYIIVCIL